MDERGVTWLRPTAWAYAQACRARDEATRAENEACALRLDEEAKRHEDAMGRLGPADDGEEEYTMHLVAATDFRSIAAAIRARIAKDKP